jgi:hypothetical protein
MSIRTGSACCRAGRHWADGASCHGSARGACSAENGKRHPEQDVETSVVQSTWPGRRRCRYFLGCPRTKRRRRSVSLGIDANAGLYEGSSKSQASGSMVLACPALNAGRRRGHASGTSSRGGLTPVGTNRINRGEHTNAHIILNSKADRSSAAMESATTEGWSHLSGTRKSR